jgi:Predicted dehydrogenases and related proteins
MSKTPIRTQYDAVVSDLESRALTAGRRLRYGVIGTGMMGREHIAAVLMQQQADIAGMHDPNAQSLACAKAMFEARNLLVPPCFDSLDAMVDSDAIDAFLICTPNFTHRAVFDRVAKSGKPIFLEKPMATTVADALYLVERTQHYASPVQVGMQYRFKSQYQLALAALDRGDLGTVHTVALCEYRPPFLSKVDEWNKFNRFSGGTLVEKCCHYFDLLNRIA